MKKSLEQSTKSVPTNKLYVLVQSTQDLGITVKTEADIVNDSGSRYSRGAGTGMPKQSVQAIVDNIKSTMG